MDLTLPPLTRRQLLLGALAAPAAVAVASCGGPTVPDLARLRVGTGPEGAVYREMGGALVDLWNGHLGEGVAQVVSTDAAVANLRMLTAGELEVAFVNVDVGRPASSGVRALLRAFDSVLHLLVPQDSPVTGIADLSGLRVSLGRPDSGTRYLAQRMLDEAGVFVEERNLSQSDGALGLLAGELDAWFSLTAMPTPAVSTLLARDDGFRFVPLGAEVSALQSRWPGEYLPVTINESIYPGIAATDSVAVPTVLCTTPAMREDVAHFLTRTTLESAAALRERRPEAAQLNPRTAVGSAPLALHPGSADYFRSVKP